MRSLTEQQVTALEGMVILYSFPSVSKEMFVAEEIVNHRIMIPLIDRCIPRSLVNSLLRL